MAVYRFEGWTLDTERGVLARDGVQATAQPKVLAALELFLTRPGALIRREELRRALWPDTRVTDQSLMQIVHKLRDLLGDGRPPLFLKTEPRRGYRFIAPVSVGDGVEVAAGDGPAVIGTTTFVGRSRELEALGELLAEPGVVTLLGPGGIGKTTLARRACRDVTPAWFVDLTDVRDETGLVASTAMALGMSLADTHGAGARDQVGRTLAAWRRCTLILDNFEQIASHAPVVAAWAAAAPDATIIVTSRERLRLAGERCVEVVGLAPEDGQTLLRSRLDALRRGLASTWSPEQIAELVDALDGIPLAIELAAPRALVLAPEALLARLNDRLALLTGGRRDGAARHRTLRATLDGSWDLLDPHERSALAQCSVFHGAFGVAEAEQVLRIDEDVVDTLADLVDKSLLRSVTPGRLRMYVAVREYAAEKLEDPDEPRERLRLGLLAMLEHEGPGGWRERQSAVLSRVDDLRAVFAASDDPATIARLGSALVSALATRSTLEDVFAIADRVVERAAELSDRELGRAYGRRGALKIARQRYRDAEDDSRTALDIAVRCADPDVDQAWIRWGVVCGRLGRHTEARASYGAALEVAEAKGDADSVAIIRHNLAILEKMTGGVRAAVPLFRACVELFEARGMDRFANNARFNLASCLAEALDPGAEEALLEARAGFLRIGEDRRATLVGTQLARVLQDRGQLQEALAWVERTLAADRRFANAGAEADDLRQLAVLLGELGDLDGSKQAFHDALEAAERVGPPARIAHCLAVFGPVLALRGETDRAIGELTRALNIAQALRDESRQLSVRFFRGMIAALSGRDVGGDLEWVVGHPSAEAPPLCHMITLARGVMAGDAMAGVDSVRALPVIPLGVRLGVRLIEASG